jgi:putative ABC transport system ATP-binding protein
MYVVETHNLKKTYGSGETTVEALKGIDLRVRQGEFLAVMGASGSGKSTLLSLLGGVDIPSQGQVLLDGENLAAMSDDERTLARRRRVGFVFQAFNLLPTLTAEENVALPLELDAVPTRDARRRAVRALQSVDVAPRRDHLPSELSGGEQQRVAIARALVIEPALVLADEPTGNLDSTSSERLMQLLDGLVRDRQQTIVMVTHDAEAAAFASRLVRLRDGCFVDGQQAGENGSKGQDSG